MEGTYRKGSHYVTCDRTGLKTRVEDVIREYTGAYVRKDWYETRHPQDFVRPRRREEGGAVRPARPDPLWQFNGALTTTLTAAAAAGDYTLNVEHTERFFAGDEIGIMLTTGDMFRVRVLHLSSSAKTFGIFVPLPHGADLGALITDYSAISAPDLG